MFVIINQQNGIVCLFVSLERQVKQNAFHAAIVAMIEHLSVRDGKAKKKKEGMRRMACSWNEMDLTSNGWYYYSNVDNGTKM